MGYTNSPSVGGLNQIKINNENIQVIRNGEVDMNLFTESLIDFFLKYMFDEEESSSNNCA